MRKAIGVGLGAAGALLLLASAAAHADDPLRCRRYQNDFTQNAPWELHELDALALLLAETPTQCPELRRDMTTRIQQLTRAAQQTVGRGGGGGGGANTGAGGAAAPTMMHINENRTEEIATRDRESNGFRYDQFPLNVRPGDLITVVMESSAVQPYVLVGEGALPNDFLALGEERAGEGQMRAELNLEVPAYDGEGQAQYYLVATSADRSRFGRYTVSVRTWDRPPPAPPRRIAIGAHVQGAITDESSRLPSGHYYEAWSFEGRAGQTVRISMNAVYDTYLIFGQMQNGRFVELERDDDGGLGVNAQITRALDADGDYVIYARPYSSGYAAGEYELRVETLQARRIDADPVPNEANGWVISGALDAGAGLDERFDYYRDYNFRTRRGRHYSASVTSYDFDPILDVGRPERGGAVAPVDFYDIDAPRRTQRTVLFDASGPNYVLRVRGYAGNAGAFQIIVSELTNAQWQAALEAQRQAAEAYADPAAEEYEAPPVEVPPEQ